MAGRASGKNRSSGCGRIELGDADGHHGIAQSITGWHVRNDDALQHGENSLLIAFVALFLLSMLGHALG